MSKVWLLLNLALSAWAQVDNPQIQSVTTDPTGNPCGATAIDLLTPSGKLYTCVSGVYALVAGSGGGGTGLTVGTTPIASGQNNSVLYQDTAKLGQDAGVGFKYYPSSEPTITGMFGLLLGNAAEPNVSVCCDGPGTTMSMVFNDSSANRFVNYVHANGCPGIDDCSLDTAYYQSRGTVASPANMGPDEIITTTDYLGYISGTYTYLVTEDAQINRGMSVIGGAKQWQIYNVGAGGMSYMMDSVNGLLFGTTYDNEDAGIRRVAAGELEINTSVAGTRGKLDVTTVNGSSLSASLPVLTDASKNLVSDVGTAFASLGTPANGASLYCSDCTVTSGVNNTCAASGSGAKAFRINGAWKCVQ